jgi:hypothetical protein
MISAGFVMFIRLAADVEKVLKSIPDSITVKMDPNLGKMLQLQKVTT